MKNALQEVLLNFRKNRELAELLTYAYLFNAQTVIHKDGAFSAHFRYVAQDVDSSTSGILDANASAVSQALGLMEDGWMVETNLVSAEDRKYAPEQKFPDVVSALIDDARRFNFEQGQTFFKSTCYLSLSYVPTDLLGKKLSKFMLDDAERKKSIDEEHRYFENTIQRFLTHFKKILSSPSIASDNVFDANELKAIEDSQLSRLQGDELITFLYQCLTGGNQKLVAPKVGFFLDAYLSAQHFTSGLVPRMGDKWIKILHIDDLPESVFPAILDELNYLGFEYRWSSRFIALSKATADKYLKTLKNRWSNKALGVVGAIKMAMGITPQLDEAAQENKYKAAHAIKQNNAGEVRYGFMTSVVVLMNEDRTKLEEAAEEISKTIEALGFKVRNELVNATEGYLGSLPGHGGYNVRKPPVDSEYVSRVLPTSSVWSGSPVAPCPFYPKGSPPLAYVRTKGSRSFRFNVHVSDVGNFLVIGPIGSGKSTLLGLIGCQFRRYPNARILVFDRDCSNRGWIKSLGGDYFDITGGEKFAPLAMLGMYQEGTPEFERELLFLIEWLCEICELRKVNIDPEKRKQIEISLRALAKSGEENLVMDLLHIQEPDVAAAINDFNSGAIRYMMNGREDRLGSNSIIGMETGPLLKFSEAIYVPVLRAIFHRLDHLFNDRRPTLLLIEEAWAPLRHKFFVRMADEWTLTLRKKNVAIGFISQNIEHFNNSEISSTIKGSCHTKIFLPNHGLYEEDTAKQYLQFGLNDQQISMIANAIPKQDYYITSPIGNRLVQLELDPLALSFISIASEKDIKKFDEIYSKENPRWVLDWLQYKNLPDWRAYAERCYFQGD